jgi:hypothetical protein
MEKKKDWTGNKAAVFVCNGATGHAKEDREINDYYATDPVAGEWLLKIEPQLNNIWESACGEGHLAEVFRKAGKLKIISDLIDRGYHPEGIGKSFGKDFLQMNKVWKGDIVTNPPYCSSVDWARHSLEVIEDGHYSALFMKLTFLEGKERKKFFTEYPPIRVWVSSSRIPCAKNGEFYKPKKDKNGEIVYNEKGESIMIKESSAACYAWFIWQKGYKGPTEVKWFN